MENKKCKELTRINSSLYSWSPGTSASTPLNATCSQIFQFWLFCARKKRKKKSACLGACSGNEVYSWSFECIYQTFANHICCFLSPFFQRNSEIKEKRKKKKGKEKENSLQKRFCSRVNVFERERKRVFRIGQVVNGNSHWELLDHLFVRFEGIFG